MKSSFFLKTKSVQEAFDQRHIRATSTVDHGRNGLNGSCLTPKLDEKNNQPHHRGGCAMQQTMNLKWRIVKMTPTRDPNSMSDFNVEHLQHIKTTTSFFTQKWSVLFVPKTLSHLSTCLCWWCWTVTKSSFKSKKDRIFNSRSNNGKREHGVALSWWSWSNQVKHFVIFWFFVVYRCLQIRLQTFHFTIRTSSTNSGFALPKSHRSATRDWLLRNRRHWLEVFWRSCRKALDGLEICRGEARALSPWGRIYSTSSLWCPRWRSEHGNSLL